MPVTVSLILDVLALVFLCLHILRGMVIWPTVLILGSGLF